MEDYDSQVLLVQKKRSSIYKNKKNVDAGDDLIVYLELTKPRLNLLDRSRDKITRNSKISNPLLVQGKCASIVRF